MAVSLARGAKKAARLVGDRLARWKEGARRSVAENPQTSARTARRFRSPKMERLHKPTGKIVRLTRVPLARERRVSVRFYKSGTFVDSPWGKPQQVNRNDLAPVPKRRKR